MFKLRWLTLIIIFGVFLFITPAESKKIEHKNSYASFDIGVVQQEDQTSSETAAGFGLTISATVTWEFEPGVTANFALGHKLNDYFALEVDLGYAYWEYSNIDFSGTITAFNGISQTFVGSASVDGSIQTLSLIPNLIITPMGKSDFSPYIGIGAGGFLWWDEVDSIGTLTINSEESGTDAAANVLAGFNFRVSSSSTFGAKYKYAWSRSRELNAEDPALHLVTASFRQRF